MRLGTRGPRLVLLACVAGGACASAPPPAPATAAPPPPARTGASALTKQPMPPGARPLIRRSVVLGRIIYLQDKASAIGTDALLAHVGNLDGLALGGFLTTPETDGSGRPIGFVVTFFTSEAAPRAAFRVRVPLEVGGHASVEEEKPPAAISGDLAVLIRARQTALAALPATRQSINPVVLRARPLTGEDGILVYLLAGTSRSNVAVFGKHHRVLVSPDGSTIQRFEALSNSALEMPTTPPRPGARTVEMVVSHLVTDYPLETHVFASLLNHLPVVVVTPHGAWHVDGDQIDFLGAVPAVGEASPAPAGVVVAPPLPACADLCARAVAQQCPHGPPSGPGCARVCELLRAGRCSDRFRDLFTCAGGSPLYVCDGRGFMTVGGCETAYDALLSCAAIYDPIRDGGEQP